MKNNNEVWSIDDYKKHYGIKSETGQKSMINSKVVQTTTSDVKSVKKPPKYRNKKIEYLGHKFDSTKEKDHYLHLIELNNASDPKEKVLKIDCQFPIDIIAYPVTLDALHTTIKICRYIADFKVEYVDGHVEFHDVKAFSKKTGKYLTTETFRLKRKMLKLLMNIEIKLI